MSGTTPTEALTALRGRGWTLGVAESLTGGAVSVALVAVPGADDLMAAQFDGAGWASLRHMCDSLGVSYPAQLRKLQGRSWATVALKAMVAADGKPRDMVMVDSKTIPMWLATIDENRVSEDARPKLIAYQREAAAALDAYFNQRAVVALGERPGPGVEQLHRGGPGFHLGAQEPPGQLGGPGGQLPPGGGVRVHHGARAQVIPPSSKGAK